MQTVGRVESLWRYPVKSMRGERLDEAFVGFSGIYGDRLYAFRSTGAPVGFPYLTGRELEHMLLFQPRFRQFESMRRPPNLDEAEALAPGVTPVYAVEPDTAVDVTAPDGKTYHIDDPTLIDRLSDGLRERHALSVVRSDRSMTDCRPVSIFGVWTARQLSDEVGTEIDKRRFRANIYIDFGSRKGFAEDDLVGETLRIGRKATMAILERDPRCKMITLDPDTAQQNPDVMRGVARNHDGKAGVYAAVLIEGTIQPGDEVAVLGPFAG
jgi:uncharacterized protein YcbX